MKQSVRGEKPLELHGGLVKAQAEPSISVTRPPAAMISATPDAMSHSLFGVSGEGRVGLAGGDQRELVGDAADRLGLDASSIGLPFAARGFAAARQHGRMRESALVAVTCDGLTVEVASEPTACPRTSRA